MVSQQDKYKIGIDARMYGPKQTGIGNYINHLLGNLAEVDKTNEYCVFLSDKECGNFKAPSANFRKVKVSSYWYSWREQIVLPWQFYKENLDLIHFPHFNSPILYRGKTVVTIHDITPLFFPGHKMGSLARRVAFQAVFHHSANHAAKIIAVSESTKKDICWHFGIKPEKIKVIYESVDAEKYALADNAETRQRIKSLKSKYGIHKPFVFYTGVWRNHKNLVGLIRAFGLLLRKYGLDCELVIGGEENPYYPEIRRTWEELGLGAYIVRPGFIDSQDLPVFYRAASLVVIPSFYEGFGLVGLEAMAGGAPVAASNRTALPEVLGDGALYFDPCNSEQMAEIMSRILTDDTFKRKLIANGFEQIKKYDWKKMAEETLKVYCEALENV